MAAESTAMSCEICYSSSSDYPDIKFVCLKECKHSFCEECFQETYRSLIEDQNALDKIKCPQFGCEVKPSEAELQQIVPQEVFEKYTKFKLK